MHRFIAFTSPKGGCGSTFVSSGVWRALAQKGFSVLSVDLNQNGGLDFATGLLNDCIYDISDVVNSDIPLDTAKCIAYECKNASFVRCSNEFVCAEQLKNKIINSDFDYVIADVPKERKDILKIADKCILVTDGMSISSRILSGYADELDFDKTFVIINKIISSYIENGTLCTVDSIVDVVGIKPIGLIPFRPQAVMAMEKGIFNINDEFLIASFLNIAQRLAGEQVPAIDFDAKTLKSEYLRKMFF